MLWTILDLRGKIPRSLFQYSINADFFVKFEKKKENVSNVLSLYINNGKFIRSSPSSEFNTLQNLIKCYNKSDLIVQRKALDYPHLDKSAGQEISSDSFFIALTAPSLTGKTQLAFSVDSKLPLYFAFSDLQAVYENFKELSNELLRQSEYDFSLARTLLKEKNVLLQDDIIKRAFIDPYLFDFKFRSLGLILALIEDAESNFSNQPDQEWMRFFAERNSDSRKILHYSSISVADFKNHPKYEEYKKKYFVFLDEFSALPQLVLVRNLCRYLSFTCLVSSTNSKIANLMGLSPRSGSGSPPPSIWSVSVPKLPPMTTEIVSLIAPDFLDNLKKLTRLATNVSEKEGKRMEIFLDYLARNQLKNSRPGVVGFIIKSIENIASKERESIKVGELLSIIAEDMVLKIFDRKSQAFSTPFGISANVKLLLGNYFESNYLPSAHSLNDYHLIDSHFFYLKNPYNQVGEPFAMYFAQLLPFPVLYLSKEHGKAGLRDPMFHIQCFFDKSEELLLLACLMADIRSSTTNAFSDSLGRQSLGDLENPNAVKSSGLYLENVATAALIDSSHFTDVKREGTFEGVDGRDFLNNLLYNLNPFMKKSRLTRLPLPLMFSDPLVEKDLESLKVPFLMPAGLAVPSFIEELFGDHSESLLFGKYSRSPDKDRIDGHFDILKNGNISTAVMECKNWSKAVPLQEYVHIIKKGIQYELKKQQQDQKAKQVKRSVLLHFTFCQTLADLDDYMALKNLKAASKNRINFLRITPLKSGQFGFNVTPIFGTWYKNASMVAIIIELGVVNKMFKDFIHYSY